uniref:EF-hand domain-containing protein n=1 Tax=Amphiprion ocellaris TaxID=80972 RepID=A0A3Q1D241_AMPOC
MSILYILKGAKRAQRASSNVFSIFEQMQIQEFKEAFTLIDQNRDGFIDQEDLKDTYASLGKLNVKDGELEEMLKEAINFTMFLNLFGEKLHGSEHQPAERVLNVHGKNIRSSGFCCSSPEVYRHFLSQFVVLCPAFLILCLLFVVLYLVFVVLCFVYDVLCVIFVVLCLFL